MTSTSLSHISECCLSCKCWNNIGKLGLINPCSATPVGAEFCPAVVPQPRMAHAVGTIGISFNDSAYSAKHAQLDRQSGERASAE